MMIITKIIIFSQDHPEKITCPTCQSDCQLGPAGVAGKYSSRDHHHHQGHHYASSQRSKHHHYFHPFHITILVLRVIIIIIIKIFAIKTMQYCNTDIMPISFFTFVKNYKNQNVQGFWQIMGCAGLRTIRFLINFDINIF